MIYFQRGNEIENLTAADLNAGLCEAMDKLGSQGKRCWRSRRILHGFIRVQD